MIKHLIQQPFVAATGVAALVHSTWSLGTFFSGVQPDSTFHLIGWLVPALLIAFSLDVGQIVTSAEIRAHGLTPARAITFLVFALATYYLQWLYIAHHMPNMPLSTGISTHMQGAALALRDMALWIIPALMPASTLLYTFSSDARPHTHEEKHKHTEDAPETETVTLEDLKQRPSNPQSTKSCQECGTSFRTRSASKKYCSDSCRVRASQKRIETRELHAGVNGEAENGAGLSTTVIT